MLENHKPLESSPAYTDRRRAYPRLPVAALAYVELDQDNGGLILNISEGGMAIQTPATFASLVFPKMRFRLPKSDKWMEASGKLVWEAKVGKEAGIQFVDLTEEVRHEIQTWIYATAIRSGPADEQGRFKIVWESAETDSAAEGATGGGPASEFDLMFPSEGSLSLPPVRSKHVSTGSDPVIGIRSPLSDADSSPLPLRNNPSIAPPVADIEPAAKRTQSAAMRVDQAQVAQLDASQSSVPSEQGIPGPPRRTASELSVEPQPLDPASDEALNAHNLRAAWRAAQFPSGKVASQQSTIRGTNVRSLGYQPAAFEEPSGKGWIFIAGILFALLLTGAVMAVGPSNVKSLLLRHFSSSAAPLASQQSDDSVRPENSSPPAASPPASVPPGDTGHAQIPPVTSPSEADHEAVRAREQDSAVSTEPDDDAAETPEKAEAAVRQFQLEHSGVAATGSYAAPQEVSGQTPVPAQSLAAAPRSESTPDAQGTREPTNSPAQTQPAPPATAPPQIAAAPGTVAVSSHFLSIKGAAPEPNDSLQIGQLASFRQPNYPVEAVRGHIEGSVVLRAAIDQVGAVQSVQLVSGPTLLFSAAYNAVRQWHYGETTLNGRAVESVEEITVVFRLGNTAASSQ